MPMTQKEMVKLLKQHGFVEVKSEGKGSHIKMKKPGVRSIPVPKGELKKRQKDKYWSKLGYYSPLLQYLMEVFYVSKLSSIVLQRTRRGLFH